MLSNFNHSNIIKVFDLLQDSANVYLVMELLNGSTLHEELHKHLKEEDEPFTEEKAREVFVK